MMPKNILRDSAIGAKFNEQYPKLLKERLFTKRNELSCAWWMALHNALVNTSPVTLGITPDEFEAFWMLKSDEDITMLQFAIINTQIEKLSFPQTCLASMESYIQLMKECGVMATWWNAENKSLRDKLTKELNAEQDAIEKNMSKEPFKPETAKA